MSVVIPNYNREDVLGTAISSTLSQVGCDVEVLVCDDGSSDSSESVVHALGDSRVRWLPGRRSGGPSHPRNRGVRAAAGDWVAFLDSDDVWLEGKLAAQLGAMREQSVLACATNATRRVAETTNGPLLFDTLPDPIRLPHMLRANRVATSTMVVSRLVLERAGAFPEQRQHTIFEDYAVWLRVAQLTPIATVNQPLAQYRDAPTASYRSQYASEFTCARNTLIDFHRWRGAQRPPIATTWREAALMARQLSSLVAVRPIIARSLAAARKRSS